MLNLLQLSRKIRNFRNINTKDKLLFFEAFLLCGIARVIILLIPFKKIKKYIGRYSQESPQEINTLHYKTIRRVAWAVNIASKYTPWESKCFVQALVAQYMLKKRKIYSTLYLGIAKNGENGISAHAWLRSGKVFVTGGGVRGNFKEIAKFSNSVSAI